MAPANAAIDIQAVQRVIASGIFRFSADSLATRADQKGITQRRKGRKESDRKMFQAIAPRNLPVTNVSVKGFTLLFLNFLGVFAPLHEMLLF
jgi:hypothetical protein